MKDMMKQAQKIQSKLLNIQNKLADKEVESSVGGGMIKIKANGAQKITSIKIEKEVIDPSDADMLQDLILVAVNDVLKKAKEMTSSEMSKITGNLKIPGII